MSLPIINRNYLQFLQSKQLYEFLKERISDNNFNSSIAAVYRFMILNAQSRSDSWLFITASMEAISSLNKELESLTNLRYREILNAILRQPKPVLEEELTLRLYKVNSETNYYTLEYGQFVKNISSQRWSALERKYSEWVRSNNFSEENFLLQVLASALKFESTFPDFRNGLIPLDVFIFNKIETEAFASAFDSQIILLNKGNFYSPFEEDISFGSLGSFFDSRISSRIVINPAYTLPLLERCTEVVKDLNTAFIFYCPYWPEERFFQELVRSGINYRLIEGNKGFYEDPYSKEIITVSFDSAEFYAYVATTSIGERSQMLIRAAELNNIWLVRKLMEQGINPSISDNAAIKATSRRGYADIVELLLTDERVDPTVGDNAPLIFAAREGYADVAEVLLRDGKVDPSTRDNLALMTAVDNGRTEVVEVLLSDDRVSPYNEENSALVLAAEKGYTDIVRLLLKDSRVDPSENNNEALIAASLSGNNEIVEVLMEDPRVRIGA